MTQTQIEEAYHALGYYDDIFGGVIFQHHKTEPCVTSTLMNEVELLYANGCKGQASVDGLTEDIAINGLWAALTTALHVVIHKEGRSYSYTWNGVRFKQNYAPDMCLERSGRDKDGQTFQCSLRYRHPGNHNSYLLHDLERCCPQAIWNECNMTPWADKF